MSDPDVKLTDSAGLVFAGPLSTFCAQYDLEPEQGFIRRTLERGKPIRYGAGDSNEFVLTLSEQ